MMVAGPAEKQAGRRTQSLAKVKGKGQTSQTGRGNQVSGMRNKRLGINPVSLQFFSGSAERKWFGDRNPTSTSAVQGAEKDQWRR
jgi:hypothetical protein